VRLQAVAGGGEAARVAVAEVVAVAVAAVAAALLPAVEAAEARQLRRAVEVADNSEDKAAAVAGRGWGQVVLGRVVPGWAAVEMVRDSAAGTDGVSTAGAVPASVRDIAADGSAGTSAEGTGIITASFHS
jgi:hypothetical protein